MIGLGGPRLPVRDRRRGRRLGWLCRPVMPDGGQSDRRLGKKPVQRPLSGGLQSADPAFASGSRSQRPLSGPAEHPGTSTARKRSCRATRARRITERREGVFHHRGRGSAAARRRLLPEGDLMLRPGPNGTSGPAEAARPGPAESGPRPAAPVMGGRDRVEEPDAGPTADRALSPESRLEDLGALGGRSGENSQKPQSAEELAGRGPARKRPG